MLQFALHGLAFPLLVALDGGTTLGVESRVA